MKKSLKPIEELKVRLKEIAHLVSISAILSWDQEVHMPSKGADVRAESLSYLSGLIHSSFIALDTNGLLSTLKKDLDTKKVKGNDAVIVRETWKDYERQHKLSESFVKELSSVTSKAQNVWIEARKKNDFKLFQPWLEKIIKLKQQEAEMIGYKDSPYDALIDQYEPGMTAGEAAKILNDLKDFLIPFIAHLKTNTKDASRLKVKGKFLKEKQIAFNHFISKALGFDFDAGKLDVSTHPFSTNFHPHDVRITTRYKEDDLFHSIGSTIHEVGHGLYEQGITGKHFGTPLGESVSLGIHESQSRMWENIIGKSKSFWKYFYPKLQKQFPEPYKKISFDSFYNTINTVQPTLIRTESDEVTYNLHIIVRFEIEKELIEGSIEVKDLPYIWKSKMKQYLGISIPNDTLGVLQDVHWSAGLIGYFPTYSFGNLYSAQFYDTIKKTIPNLDREISKGNFAPILLWLRKNIHSKGKTYRAGELVKKITGEDLNSKYFTEYLEHKYKTT